MRSGYQKGPKLPGLLLDEIGASRSKSSSRARRRQPGLGSRKEQRKALRQQKKVHQRQHKPSARSGKSAGEARDDGSAANEDEDFIADPWGGDEDPSEPDEEVKADELKSILKKPTKQASPAPRSHDKSPSPPSKVSRRIKEMLAEDDAEIAALEKKLGVKSKDKLPKSFEEDGLGDLLDGLDDFVSTSGKRQREEYEAWLRNKRRKAGTDVFEGFSDDEDEDEDEEFTTNEVPEQINSASPDLAFEEFSDEDSLMDGLEGDDDDDANEEDLEESSENSDNDSPPVTGKPRIREDPYRPPLSADEASRPKYVPPALRGATSLDTELLARLRRQLQGLLNRLSEANMLTVLKDIEEVYQSNPRQHVTSTLLDLLVALVSNRANLNDAFIILHAGFLAAIYKVAGTQFGAQFSERLVTEIDEQYSLEKSNKSGSKKVTNLIALLAELYTFQVVGSNIIFDYIRSFLDELSELNTELLLKIIRNCGQQLRQEDPFSLKDIVILLQRAVMQSGGEDKLPVRTKFMIETIHNLKNNRQKAGTEASALAHEHRTRMKKTLGTLNARSKATEPLGVALHDLRNSKKEGQWWLVGASWKKHHDADKPETSSAPTLSQSLSANHKHPESTAEPDILAVARAQGMTTPVRRAIFAALLSATDYADAHGHLAKLRLSRKQELEIPRVLLHLVGAEENYNPYYTLVARKLCGESHRMKMAFQFGLWGVLRGMGEKMVGGHDDDYDEEGGFDGDGGGMGESQGERELRKTVNLAWCYGDLVAEEKVPVTALKTLDWAYLKERTRLFVEILMVRVFQKAKSEEAVVRIFAKAKDAPQMVTGLKYLLENVVAKTDIVGGKKEKERVRNGVKAANAALGLLASSAMR